MSSTVLVMGLLVTLAAAVTGCSSSSRTAPCQSNENYCVGDTAYTCSTTEEEGYRSTHQCDPTTEACISGFCEKLTNVPCDPAGDVCDPSGRSAYRECAKGFYVFKIDCNDPELCAVAPHPEGKNHAGCAIGPFESCGFTVAFCRDNRVLACDPDLALLRVRQDCSPNTCTPHEGAEARCF